MARFLDMHRGVKLSSQERESRAKEIKEGKVSEFGVRTLNMYYNEPTGTTFCLCEAPNTDALRKHHDKIRLSLGDVWEIKSLA